MNGGGSSESGSSENEDLHPRRNDRGQLVNGRRRFGDVFGDPQPGPSRWNRLRITGLGLREYVNEEQGPSCPKKIRRIVLNPNRLGRRRSLTEPGNSSSAPFTGYYSEGDNTPVNLSRQRHSMKRRCYTPPEYFGDPITRISPIGAESKVESYTSSKASSAVEILSEDSLSNDVFYEDSPNLRLNSVITWTTFLNYFVIGHLIPNFENAGIPFDAFWQMTTEQFKAIGIHRRRELAILAKIQHSYTGRSHLSKKDKND